MRFIPFGGGHHIGASAYLLELDGYRFLIDAGVEPGRQHRKCDFDALARLAGLNRASELDAIFITHAHLDHVGGLLDLLTQAPHVPVYFHPHTAVMARVIFDAIPGIKDNTGKRRGYLRFLDAQDYNADRQFDQPFHPYAGVREHTVEVTFLCAGHIPGAACIRFRGQEGTVLMTGDFNDRSSLFLTGTAHNPAFEQVPIDLLVLEGTYAGKLHPTGPGIIEAEELAEVVGRVVERGGLAVLPAFALGRSQEVLGLLSQAMQAGRLPQVPVWYDGMTAHYCALYHRLFPDFLLGSSFRNALGLDGEGSAPAEAPLTGPAVLVPSAGMLQTGTPAARYVIHALKDAKNAVILTGYQANGTLGSKLYGLAAHPERARSITVGVQNIRVEAEVYSCQLSAHADHAGLVDMVRRTRPSRLALIHRHADQAALDRFVEEIRPVDVFMPRDGEAVG